MTSKLKHIYAPTRSHPPLSSSSFVLGHRTRINYCIIAHPFFLSFFFPLDAISFGRYSCAFSCVLEQYVDASVLQPLFFVFLEREYCTTNMTCYVLNKRTNDSRRTRRRASKKVILSRESDHFDRFHPKKTIVRPYLISFRIDTHPRHDIVPLHILLLHRTTPFHGYQSFL